MSFWAELGIWMCALWIASIATTLKDILKAMKGQQP